MNPADGSQGATGAGNPLAVPGPTEPPPDHRLVLNGDPRYGWKLRCVHPHGDSRWVSTTEDGEVDSSDCWVRSWWDEEGLDLVDYDADGWPSMAVSLPVVVDGDGWGDPPVIGPYVRPQVEPGGSAGSSQGATGAGGSATPGPVELSR